MKKRHRQIVEALRSLGGVATTRQIADKLGWNVNGVSQSLGALHPIIRYDDERWKPAAGADAHWRLYDQKRRP